MPATILARAFLSGLGGEIGRGLTALGSERVDMFGSWIVKCEGVCCHACDGASSLANGSNLKSARLTWPVRRRGTFSPTPTPLPRTFNECVELIAAGRPGGLYKGRSVEVKLVCTVRTDMIESTAWYERVTGLLRETLLVVEASEENATTTTTTKYLGKLQRAQLRIYASPNPKLALEHPNPIWQHMLSS